MLPIMKKILISQLVLLALVVPVAFALAGQGRGGGPVDRQGFSRTTEGSSTNSSEWTNIPAFKGVTTSCPGVGGATATVSIDLQGGAGPVEVRVRMNDFTLSVVGEGPVGRPMRPKMATFDTGTGAVDEHETFSYTFVARRLPGEHGVRFRVQWRSPDQNTITLRHATLSTLWSDAKGTCL